LVGILKDIDQPDRGMEPDGEPIRNEVRIGLDHPLIERVASRSPILIKRLARNGELFDSKVVENAAWIGLQERLSRSEKVVAKPKPQLDYREVLFGLPPRR